MAGNTIKMKDLPSSESSRVTDLIGLDRNGQSVKLPNEQNEIKTEVANLGSKVGELIGKDSQIINIDLHSSQYEKISYFISSTNTWQFGGNCRGYSIPFSQYAGATLNIQYANVDGSASTFQFLKSFDTETITRGAKTDSCDGGSASLRSGIYTIPSDCAFLFVNISPTSALNEVYPIELKVTIEGEEGLINGINKSIETLEESVSNTYTKAQSDEKFADKTDITKVENEIEKLVGTSEIVIDLHSSQYEKIKFFISSTNAWQLDGNCRGYSIDATQYRGQNITVTYPDTTATAATFQFLKSFNASTIVRGDKVDMCDDYKGANPLRSGDYIVPNDCNYIFFNISPTSALNEVYPALIKIVGASGGVIPSMKKDISDIKEELENIDVKANIYAVNPYNLIDVPIYSEPAWSYKTDIMNKFYGFFDTLASENEGYVSTTILDSSSQYADIVAQKTSGYTPTTYPIKMYRFTPIGNRSGVRLLKIMLVGGTHAEYPSIWCLSRLMHNIVNKWNENKTLSELRYGVEFIVLPLSVPYLPATLSTKNENGVNLNRNCDTAPQAPWQSGADCGVSANSEYETKMFQRCVNLVQPDAFIDIHNFTQNDYNTYKSLSVPFIPIQDTKLPNLVWQTLQESTSVVVKTYSDDVIEPKGDVYGEIIKYTSTTGSGRRAQWVANQFGIPSLNLELRQSFNWSNKEYAPSSNVGDEKTTSIGTYILTNMICKLISHLA